MSDAETEDQAAWREWKRREGHNVQWAHETLFLAGRQSQAARIAELEDALRPLAFTVFDEEQLEPVSAQSIWQTIYLERVKDWIDFDAIADARAALNSKETQ